MSIQEQTPRGVAGPTKEEAAKLNAGVVVSPIEKALIESTRNHWVRRGAAVVGTLVGFGATQIIEPKAIPAIVKPISGALDAYRALTIPSVGEIFNPNAGGGEISDKNIKNVSLQDALSIARGQTSRTKRYYFLLPKEAAPTLLKYEVKQLPYSEMTGFWGLSTGATFVSPYDGYLTWAIYENNGAMTIRIRKMQSYEGNQEQQDKGQIEYVVQDAELLLPQELFTTRKIGPEGAATIYSSEVPIRAGQDIFRLTSDRTVQGSYADIGSYQVVVNGARILSEDNKAIKIIS